MRHGRLVKWFAMLVLVCAVPSYSAIYKCINADGKVAYQDFPCESNQQSKPVRFNENVTNVVNSGSGNSNSNAQAQLVADSVVGVWGSDDRHVNLMPDGTILIDIHQGEMLSGHWFKVGKEYRVSITRNQKPVALNLSYRKSEDGLFLSSLKFTDDMVRFWRADELTIDAVNRYQAPDE